MRKRLIAGAFVVLAVAVCAMAADIGGKWGGTVTMRNGAELDVAFEFTVTGSKLTGTYDGPPRGKDVVSEGAIAGAKISFTTDNGKSKWNGSVSADEIAGTVTRQMERGAQDLPFVLKRAK